MPVPREQKAVSTRARGCGVQEISPLQPSWCLPLPSQGISFCKGSNILARKAEGLGELLPSHRRREARLEQGQRPRTAEDQWPRTPKNARDPRKPEAWSRFRRRGIQADFLLMA